MSIAKAKVTPLVVDKMTQGITNEAVDALNALNDRILAKIFPKDANLSLKMVIGRIRGMDDVTLLMANEYANPKVVNNETPDIISLATANKMIRAYAGNVKVPEETKVYTSFFIEAVISMVVRSAVKSAEFRGVSKVDLKDIRDALNKDNNINSLKKFATGSVRRRMSSPRKRLSAKKSGSKKKKSGSKKKKSKSKSKSTKKCPQGKRAVHSYKYKSSSGKKVKVKAYCRKKSASRK